MVYVVDLTDRQKETNYAKSQFYQCLAVQRDSVKGSLVDEDGLDGLLEENQMHNPTLLEKLLKSNFPYLPLYANCSSTGAC